MRHSTKSQFKKKPNKPNNRQKQVMSHGSKWVFLVVNGSKGEKRRHKTP